jgi:hypothetical protein
VSRVADGRAGARLQAVLGIAAMVGVAALATTMTRSNPLAAAASWLSGLDRTLTTPEASWVQRLDDQPDSAVVTGGAVVFVTASGADARGLGDGGELWRRDAHWVAAAGRETVLVGTSRTAFEALDPSTGATKWRADGSAVWSYVDGVVSLTCPVGRDCVLTARTPGDGAVRWRTPLPGGERKPSGLQPSTAPYLPVLVGVQLGDRFHVVASSDGRKVDDEKTGENGGVTVRGGRIVHYTAADDGVCTVEIGGTRRSAGGKRACDREPAGTEALLVRTRADGAPVLVSTDRGRDAWVGEAGETVVAVDDRAAVVRSADRSSYAVVEVASGRRVWTRKVTGLVEVTLTPSAVLLTDLDRGRLLSLDRLTGRPFADLATQATVIGYGDSDAVLANGRTVGVVPLNRPPR